MDDVTRSVMDAWPGDTEFVILRKDDWDTVVDMMRQWNVADLPFYDMHLVPLVLDPPEEEENG